MRRRKIKKASASRVDDMSRGTHRYFETHEQATAYANEALAKAIAAGEQSQDRFYIWNAGTCYSVGV